MDPNFVILGLFFLLFFCLPNGVFIASLMNIRIKRGTPALRFVATLFTAPTAVLSAVQLILEWTVDRENELRSMVIGLLTLSLPLGLVGSATYLVGFTKNKGEISSPEKTCLLVTVILLIYILATPAIHPNL